MKKIIVLLFMILSQAAGHGYMSNPPARNSVQLGTPSYIAVGGNGVAFTGGGPNILPGVCGDPFDISPLGSFANRPFQSRITYRQGDVIEIQLTLSANHGGRHAFRLCQGRIPSEDCFQGNWLLADTVQPSTSQFVPKAGSRYLYIPWIGGTGDNGETWWTQYYTVRYKLPDSVSCEDGCILQWIWWTSHKCAQPCQPELGSQEDLSQCGRGMWGRVCNLTRPDWEEFRNCADIMITPISNRSPPPIVSLRPPLSISSPPPPIVSPRPPVSISLPPYPIPSSLPSMPSKKPPEKPIRKANDWSLCGGKLGICLDECTKSQWSHTSCLNEDSTCERVTHDIWLCVPKSCCAPKNKDKCTVKGKVRCTL